MTEGTISIPKRTNEKVSVVMEETKFSAVRIWRYWNAHGSLILEDCETYKFATVKLEEVSYDWLDEHWVEHRAILNGEEVSGDVFDAKDVDGKILNIKVIDGWG